MSDLDLTAVRGIGPATAKVLAEHGLSTAQAVVEATPEALLAVPGFGPARAKTVKAAATRSLTEASPTTQPPEEKAKKKAVGQKKGKKKKK